ncbi:MAG: LPS-assembly protein LptD [Desulfobacteraceae bacterium]|nr:MAG: LPS-assembly protein LptD [Desulfobacteraceae bacterium]
MHQRKHIENRRFLFSQKKGSKVPSREYIFCYLNILLIIFVFLSIIPSDVFALSGDNRFKDDDPDEPWNISADEISHDRNTNIYTASGNVVISKKNTRLSADFVRFDHNAFRAFAQGNVVMKAGEDILSGSSLDVDLKSETGIIYDGSVFIKENNFHISGGNIEKTGENSYAAEEATVSTCDGETPAWKITGKKLKINIEGYGFINHATLWTKKMPVIYTPFFVFPAKLKRQSGLLSPQIGQSDRKGIEYNQPYFWAIDENTDATFYAHYMSKRGEKAGFEYRYVSSAESKGTVMFDFLDDRREDDGTGDSSKKWGYEDDTSLRSNSDRYWFRMKNDHKMPFGFNAKVDLDFVSDQDYLHEFREGYNGFNSTESYFNKYFGREIDNYDDPVRINRLNLSKNWSSFTLNAETRWYDNVVNRRWSDTDNTLHKLPVIEFDASKQQVSGMPLYADLNSEYTNFYRKDGTSGHRIDLYPRVYLPLKFKKFFTVEPSLGLRNTTWYIDPSGSDTTENDTTYNRELFDFKLDLSTELFGVFKINSEHVDSIKHSIKPQIVYNYIPDEEQADYPYFDSIDRITGSNLITYSLTNTFTSRSLSGKIGGDGEKDQEKPSYAYNEFLRIKIEQSYDIKEEREHSKDGRPFSPVYGELKLSPVKYISLSADATWSTYDGWFVTRNASGALSDNRGDSLFAEYRFDRDSIESLLSILNLKIFDNLLLKADHELNIRDNRRIKTGIGFLYTAQCWSVDLRYTDEVDDKIYSFMINLTGLGGIGN